MWQLAFCLCFSPHRHCFRDISFKPSASEEPAPLPSPLETVATNADLCKTSICLLLSCSRAQLTSQSSLGRDAGVTLASSTRVSTCVRRATSLPNSKSRTRPNRLPCKQRQLLSPAQSSSKALTPTCLPLDDVDDLGLDRRRHLVSFLREQEAERTKKRNVLGEAIPRMRRFACQAERAESRPVDETASALELRDERVLRRKDVLDLFPELGAVIIPSRITDVPVGLSSSASGSPGGASGTHQS